MGKMEYNLTNKIDFSLIAVKNEFPPDLSVYQLVKPMYRINSTKIIN
jgi:hypothetical protein